VRKHVLEPLKLAGYYDSTGRFDHASLDALIDAALQSQITPEGRRNPPSDLEYVALASMRLEPIVAAIQAWRADEVQVLIDALDARWDAMTRAARFDLDLGDVADWLLTHEGLPDRAAAVSACIAVVPPVGVKVCSRLVQTGKKKRVFAARWTSADDPVDIVLKEFLEPSDEGLIRERRSHPLSITHPNIVQTFTVDNQESPPKTFLIERRLEVIDVSDLPYGYAESARMLVDLGRAVACLADHGLLHGDIKPGNIGRKGDRFILLDFGACTLHTEPPQRGSMRTRAPEALLNPTEKSLPSDVWALGATVLKCLTGSYPLVDTEDDWDTDPEKKIKFEQDMKKRVERGWSARLENVRHEGFRRILREMLGPDPAERPTAAEVTAWAMRDLPALAGLQEGPRVAPSQELRALCQHLSADPAALELMSARTRGLFERRLDAAEQAIRARHSFYMPTRKLAEGAALTNQSPLLDSSQRDIAQRIQHAAEAALVSRDQEPEIQDIQDLRRRLRLAAPLGEGEEGPHLLEAVRAGLADSKLRDSALRAQLQAVEGLLRGT
jgi:hypothetical protein